MFVDCRDLPNFLPCDVNEPCRTRPGTPFGTCSLIGSMVVLSYFTLLLSSDPTSPDERRYLQRLLYL